MVAIPFHPWLPASNPSGDATPSHLIAFASSSLRLGDHFRERCAAGLHLILRSPSSSSEDHRSGNLSPKNNFWCKEKHFLKRNSVLDKFSEGCSSFFSFFHGEESGGRYLDRERDQKNNSEGKPFGGKLWTNVLLAVNVMYEVASMYDTINELDTGTQVYVAQVATQGKLLLWGAKVNSLIDKGQLWRLATSSLLHANIGHLMINCYSLNSIGPTVEQLTGPRRFLAVYFSSAIASSVMSYNFCQSPAVGASGAIFGLVGSYAIFILRHRRLLGGGKKDLQHIAHVITLNLAIGFLSKGIDNWGHLGGLLGGAAVSWFLGPAWQYVSQSADGRLVLADRAPIFHFINWKKRLP